MSAAKANDKDFQDMKIVLVTLIIVLYRISEFINLIIYKVTCHLILIKLL